MGLMPLEFTDCLTDSPVFRENLHNHERELERTNQAIKNLIKEVKELISAAKNLSRAQRSLSNNLINFQFECIGNSQTDDEIKISGSLKELGRLIATIEDERDRMLDQAYDQILAPLEKFRKDNVGSVKEGKKKYDKHTSKFCQSQERYLSISTKKPESHLQEADASLEMEQRHFCQASLEYVFLLQSVQEKKKFEFVEILLGFIYRWLTFYHEGYVAADEFKPYMTNLQIRVQRTRDNFLATQEEAEQLMKKMLEVRKTKPLDSGCLNKSYTRQGYLFLMEKKKLGTTWCKHYCTHRKETRQFTMTPYNQISTKMNTPDSFKVESCVRRMSDSIDKRFCFDITAEERPGIVYTFQAMSEEDRKLWIDAMDGKEPTYAPSYAQPSKPSEETHLNDAGFNFVNACINELENRGLEEQGLYRVGGVASKVNKFLLMGLDRRKSDKINLSDPFEWESKTLTSGLKTYFRNLPEPLLTFTYYCDFICSAKHEAKTHRAHDIHTLVHKLPSQNYHMLKILMSHLSKVAAKSDKNMMTVSNLGVCFGPTLLRSEEESMAVIMDIKFCNIVVEILIEYNEKIFQTEPLSGDSGGMKNSYRISPTSTQPAKQILTKPLPPSVVNTQHGYSTNNSQHSSTNSQQTNTQPVTHAVVSVYNDGPQRINMDTPPRQQQQTYIEHSPSSHSLYEERVTRQPEIRYNSVGADLHRAPRSRPHPVYNPANLGDIIDSPRVNSISSSTESLSSKSSGRELGVSSSTSPQGRGRVGVHYPPGYKTQEVRVRTLYACMGENESELSFEPNQIITNVRRSQEPGWLQGTLNGKTGLVPENYVQMLP